MRGQLCQKSKWAINDKIRKDYARCVGLKENATWKKFS
jgi:hypothetical protein